MGITVCSSPARPRGVDNRVYFPRLRSTILLMKILKDRRSLIIAAAVFVVVALLTYRFSGAILRANNVDAVPVSANEPNLAVAREVSSVATYESPGGTDKVRFTIGLDAGGRVISVKSTDALKGDEVSDNLAKFSTGLLLVIRGKKLSEFSGVDRIGKSSLTTAAFNASLSALKAQL